MATSMGKLSIGVSVHEEKMNGKNVFVVEAMELGISDFGETLDEALNNLKSAVQLLLESDSKKKELLLKEEPQMITRIFL